MQQVVEDEGAAETQISDHDNNPGNKTRDGRDIGEPGEDLGTRVGDVKVGEETNGPCGKDCNPGYTIAVGDAEQLGGLAVQRHGVENTTARVEEGISG